MAGHGSTPPDDRANHPARQVSRYTMGEGFGGVSAEYEALGNDDDVWGDIRGPSPKRTPEEVSKRYLED